MSMASRKSAFIAAIKSAANAPTDPDAAIGALFDALVDVVSHMTITVTPATAPLTNSGGPVLGTINPTGAEGAIS